MNSCRDDHPDATRPKVVDDIGSAGDPLVHAVEEYLLQVEAGVAIDREAFVSRFPTIANELRDCLEGFEFVDGVAPKVRARERENRAQEAQLQPSVALGDYRIIREIGRGGMGVVYEAEQVSIGRKVALKVLPFAAVLDRKNLTRFKHEAQAAGALKHPHIVGVHAVGCERGVHYYAMELVEGQSLAEVIAGQNAPAEATPADETTPLAMLSTKKSRGNSTRYRIVAELGVQAAEALAHAHASGIIHRDIKPSNLMVDDSGHLWVTDFGLAQIEGDMRQLTMTGDLLGTLRYMSPEQAAGNHRLLDHRTDVYSLGVTLYELLTGRPAFQGDEPGKLLREIADWEPPAPRQIDPYIPRDLETVILKAINKEISSRYGGAEELATDLQRYLDHKSILARRPSLANRSMRWCRRNRMISLLSFCLVVVSLATSVVVMGQRARLTSPAVKPPDAELNVRLVHRGGVETDGNLSPDGRLLVYPNWKTANIAVFNLETMGRLDASTDGSWDAPAGYGEEAVWSHNGKYLAYNWYTRAGAQLRIMGSDGSGQRIAYKTDGEIVWPTSWSGDGRHVLAHLVDTEHRMRTQLIDVATGAARTLHTFDPPVPSPQRLSPDGAHVVYSRSPSVDAALQDVHLINTKSGEASPLVEHPANDYAAYWTPDGRWIVFLSDRGGSTGLWAMPFRDGRRVGDPRLVYAPLEAIAPKGFDKQGSYYYVTRQPTTNVYTAEIDFENNAVRAAPRKLASKYEGRNISADWSADGTRLVYSSQLGQNGVQARLTIRNIETGTETDIRLNSSLRRLHRTSQFEWAGSGNSLLMLARGTRELFSWFQIEVPSGEAREVLQKVLPPGGLQRWTLSRNGEFLYLTRDGQLIRADVRNETAESIYRLAPQDKSFRDVAVSPDGSLVAVIIHPQSEIRLVSSQSGDARTVYRPSPNSPRVLASKTLAWTPDGTRLVFGSHTANDDTNVSLWQLPVAGGEPQALGINMPALRSPRIHPDGRRILFVASSQVGDSKLWAIDNVLAHLNASE